MCRTFRKNTENQYRTETQIEFNITFINDRLSKLPDNYKS